MTTSVQAGDAVDVNLTPLLDLVLQLIMFFMITINFVQAEQFASGVKLPVAQMAVPLDNKAKYRIFLNLAIDKKHDKAQLVGNLDSLTLDTPGKLHAYLLSTKEDLERKAKANGEASMEAVVVIRADKECRYGEVWDVVEQCQNAGFMRWQLRVMTGGG